MRINIQIPLSRYWKIIMLPILFFLTSCDFGTNNDTDDTVYYSFDSHIANDSSAIGAIDSAESHSDGDYLPLTEVTVKAIPTVAGSYFEGWYTSESGDTTVSEENPYTFPLLRNTTLYARFTRPIIYPAANTDDYDPGTGWVLAWEDDFNDGTFDSETWDREVPNQRFNNELQLYTGEASTAYEQNGYMILKADHTGSDYSYENFTSARVISNPGGGDGTSGSAGKVFQFGKIAARIQLPSGKGIWPAFWMLGDNISETGGDTPWPSCGEIDILESGSQYAFDGYYGHATVGQAMHYDQSIDNSAGYSQWHYKSGSMRNSEGMYANEFHVFEIEWDASSITWKVDGAIAHSEDISADNMTEFRENFYVIFNIAVGGSYTYSPDETTDFPQYMYIDWIRHYTN